jgi:hypothetical protein
MQVGVVDPQAAPWQFTTPGGATTWTSSPGPAAWRTPSRYAADGPAITTLAGNRSAAARQ